MTTFCAECGDDTGINGIDLKDGRHTHYSAISCRDILRKKAEAYRKLLWVIARNYDGLQLHVSNQDLAAIPDGAELLMWNEPLFDSVILKAISSPIDQPDIATRVRGPKEGS